MVKHKYVVTKIAGSEHEHGSHYSEPCVSWKVTCECGYVFNEDTCYPPSDYPDKSATLRMTEHRLNWLEKKVNSLLIGHVKLK